MRTITARIGVDPARITWLDGPSGDSVCIRFNLTSVKPGDYGYPLTPAELAPSLDAPAGSMFATVDAEAVAPYLFAGWAK